MRIEEQTIEQIKSRVAIEEIVSDYVGLKPRGPRSWACCPFHAEKTPSFSVIPALGIYKCFGCGKGGDAISFLQEINKMSYTEALLHIAEKYHIEVSYDNRDSESSTHHQAKEGLYALMSFAAGHYVDLLQKHREGQSTGLRYLKERGLDDEIISKFSIGYALRAGRDFSKTAQKRGHTIEQLRSAGLIHQNSERDIFTGRVLFPIHNLSGKIIAFGARSLGSSNPKYLNSPETSIYQKNQALYGLYQALSSIRSTQDVYIVEGYMDLLTMARYGYNNVVAVAGTSLTEAQARLLKRFATSVTILFDGDSAGQQATLRSIDTLLSVGLNVSAASLPKEMDPDSFLRTRGKDTFDTYIQSERRSFISFKKKYLQETLGRKPHAEAETIRSILHSIQLIPDELTQYTLIKACSKELNVPEELLRRHLSKPTTNVPSESQPITASDEATPAPGELILRHQEGEILKMLLTYGPSFEFLSHYVITELEELSFSHSPYAALWASLQDTMRRDERIDYSTFYAHHDASIKATIQALLPKQKTPELPSEQEVQLLAKQGIIRLKRAYIGQKIQENVRALEQISGAGSDAEEEQLLVEHKRLKHLYGHLSHLLESVVFLRDTT